MQMVRIIEEILTAVDFIGTIAAIWYSVAQLVRIDALLIGTGEASLIRTLIDTVLFVAFICTVRSFVASPCFRYAFFAVRALEFIGHRAFLLALFRAQFRADE